MAITDSSSDALRRESSDALEGLVAEGLGLLDAGDLEGWERLCAEHPSRAAELRAALGRLQGSGLVDLAASVTAEGIPERLGEFRLLERLGSGGMGVVYLAEQEPLGRRVALKILRPEQLYFEVSRRRFQREVRAVARLAHPGIVGIYTVGEEAGLPYFAMEYVQGLSLAQSLRGLGEVSAKELVGQDLMRFQRDAPLGAAPRALAGGWVEAAVRVVLQVAEALAHAHARGVLHRDVKPSNVMLTPEGDARLLDFGLADLADASPLTRSGAQPGSIPYMAPEQVLGQAEQVGPHTDVYGLGVTLYELLTLRLPFPQTELHALQNAITRGSWASPKRFNPELSADLLSVCAKAMEVDPLRRYPSAEALARDLQNLLAFRRVEARRASLPARALRFARRHPAGALAAGLAGLVLVGGPALYIVQEQRSRQKLQEVNQRLEAALDAADLRLAQAQEVVHLASTVALEELHGPEHASARARLREGTMGFYLAALGEGSQDSPITLDGILARKRLARDRRFDGDYAAAEEVLRDGLHRLEALNSEQQEPWFQAQFVSVLSNLASTLLIQGQSEEALGLYLHRQRLAEAELAGQRGSRLDADVLRRMASAHWGLSRYAAFVGDAHAYEQELLASEHIETQLHLRDPQDPAQEAGLCNTRHTRAILLREAGRLEEAWALLLETGERVERLLGEDAEDPHCTAEYFRSLAEKGLVLAALDQPASAAEYLRQAIAYGRLLQDEQPWNINVRRMLLDYWCQMGEDDLRSGDRARARDLCAEALRWLPELLDAGRDLPEFQHIASRVFGLQAQLADVREPTDAARSAYARALAHAQQACQLAPGIERFAATRDSWQALAADLERQRR